MPFLLILFLSLVACKPNSTSYSLSSERSDESTDICDHESSLEWGCKLQKFRFEPSQEWHKSNFKIEEGKEYQISVRLSRDWSDSGVKSNLGGWTEYKTISQVYSPMRRSREMKFYQLAFCQNQSYDDCHVLERRKTSFKPDFSGHLYFFVNDVSNFAFNNKGFADIEIKELLK